MNDKFARTVRTLYRLEQSPPSSRRTERLFRLWRYASRAWGERVIIDSIRSLHGRACAGKP